MRKIKQVCKGYTLERHHAKCESLNTKQGLPCLEASCTTTLVHWGKSHFKSSISCQKQSLVGLIRQCVLPSWSAMTCLWHVSLKKTRVKSVLGRRSLLYQKLADHISNETKCRPLTKPSKWASKWRHWSRASRKDQKSRKKATYFNILLESDDGYFKPDRKRWFPCIRLRTLRFFTDVSTAISLPNGDLNLLFCYSSEKTW